MSVVKFLFGCQYKSSFFIVIRLNIKCKAYHMPVIGCIQQSSGEAFPTFSLSLEPIPLSRPIV